MKKHYSFWPGLLGSFKRYSLVALLGGSLCQITQAQQTYTFTNATATGATGPTALQVSTAYNTTNLSGSVTVSGGIQSFTIPAAGNYKIEAWGAAGGMNTYASGYPGGLGAYMSGEFTFTAGTVVKILVGQMGGDTHAASGSGSDWEKAGAGGGGGTFVFYNVTDPLPVIAAGGGGGGGSSSTPSIHASITTTGNVSALGALGGVSGNGGQLNTVGADYYAGCGSGWLTDGTGGNNTSLYSYIGGIWGANGGRTPANGATGGTRYNDGYDEGGDGGFGGGGGGTSDNGGTGGGGGFSGGAGGNQGPSPYANYTGGGGGSYNSGTAQVNTASVNAGHGKVIITELCNITLVATGTDTNGAICTGNSVTLTTNAISNYSWSTGATTSSIVVSPTATTLYSLTAVSPSNCTTSAALTITVDVGSPTLSVVNTASSSGGICPNTTVILTASGATSYSWTGGSIPVTNGAVFSPTSAVDYSVTGTNGCGTGTAVTSVSVHPFPSVTPVASTSSLCSGNSVTLTGVGDATLYAWSGGAGGITDGVGFSPILTATYTVIGTSALSCTASATIPVTVVTTPSLAPTAQPQLICIGNSSTLTATGAASYTWTDGSTTANTSTFLTTPTGTGITTYTVMRANSTCTTSQQISVITNSLPTLFAIVAPTLVCALNPATLAVGGGQTYTWTSPGNPPSVPSFSFTGPSPVVYPPVPTTYTVAASDGTCINTTTVGLAVDPNPTITTMPTAPMVCSGESVGITANGGINYTWTATSGTFYTQSITDMPTISSAYNVQGDNSFGCITSANQVIVVNPNPTVTAVANKTLVCSTGPTTLTAGGANTYVWDNSAMTNTTIVNPVNTTSGPVVFSVTGTYTSTGCHTTKTVQVSVFVPTLTVSGNTNTCSGGQINLTASGGTGNSYSWLVPGNPPYGFSTLNTTVSAPSVFTVTAMTTSLTVSCPGTKTVDIGIYYNPTITATPERTAICTKEMVVLTATGGVTYLWSNNAGGETITVNPASTTNYTVTGTDANGCTSTGTVQVKVLGCAGIGEAGLINTGLSIYPNPNNGEFYIQANTNLNLTLVNELGQTVRSIALLGSNNYKVSVGELAKGIYFITGQKDGLQINQKIVVVK